MTVHPNVRMTVDQYLSWATGQEGRFELIDGVVETMAPETLSHVETKTGIHDALRAALRSLNLPCHAVGDGATVRVDDHTAFEPDALVYCGPKLPGSTIEVAEPVIVAEVLSPRNALRDLRDKLEGYFRVASIQHYLIVDPDKRIVIHHRRAGEGGLLTQILDNGMLQLDPPGLSLSLSDLFPPAD